MLKTWPGGGGGNQSVITIQPYTMTPLSTAVSCVMVLEGGWVGAVVTNAFHSYYARWYMSTAVKEKCDKIKWK